MLSDHSGGLQPEIKVSLAGLVLLEPLREKSSPVSLSASGGCWQSLAFLGVCVDADSHLCFHLDAVFFLSESVGLGPT